VVQTIDRKIHNNRAPYWAFVLIILCCIGLLTNWVNLGTFWKGYALDMVGPAWSYILFRGLFTSRTENRWTRFFTPGRTLIVILIICFGIELTQYFELYDATYDPWDFLAYTIILVPIFVVDLLQNQKSRR
jgi:hypothetical protein